MATNIGAQNNVLGIQNLSTTITSLSNIALINPQQNTGYKVQPAIIPSGATQQTIDGNGYLFHYEGENGITLESDITDSYIEDNSVINDHIAIKPEIVTVQGFIGELNDIFPLAPAGYGATFVASKLTSISAYAPELTASALVVLNEVVLAYEVAANVVQTVGQDIATYNGQQYLTKQAWYYAKFYAAWRDRTLFTIQTPWNKMGNMAIQSLRVIQDASTRMISDFEITFKKLRFVDTSIVTNNMLQKMNADGRRGASDSAIQDQGENTLLSSANSFSDVLSGIGSS